MRRILLSLGLLVALLGIGSLLTAPAYAAWNPFSNSNSESVCRKAGTHSSAVCTANGNDPISGSNGVLIKITRLIANVAGLVAIFMMITGGIMYILSNGDTGKVTTAKNTLIYAAVGLVIIALGQTLIVFILNRVAP